MSLRVWLPLTKDLRNQGLDNVTVTNNGAIFNENGKLGGCYYFNGSGYLTIPFNYSNFIDEFSVALWVNFPNTVNTYTEILNMANSAGWNVIYFGMVIPSNTTNICCSVANGTNYLAQTLNTGNIGTNTWTHITCTYNKGVMIVYVNGIIKQTYTTSIVPKFSAATRIGIGAASNGAEKSTSYLNDVRIYDHALSPLEVKQISQGLILHYPLNRNGLGQENLIRNTDFGGISQKYTVTSGTEGGFIYTPTETIVANTEYIVSCRLRGNANMNLYKLCTGGNEALNWVNRSQLSTTEYRPFSIVFTCPSNKTLNQIYICTRYGTASTSTGDWFEIESCSLKLEKGSIATPWCPNSSDELAITMGLNDNVEYDVSGYGNNGEYYAYDTNGSISYTSDTPKYNVSTHIASANPTQNAASGTRYLYGHCKLTNPTQMSVAFWLKPITGGYGGTTSNGQGYFCTTNYEYGNTSVGSDYQDSAMNHRDGTVDMNDSASTTQCRVTFYPTIGEWHHYVYTYDGQVGRGYKDGVQTATAQFSAAKTLDSFIGVVIGFSKAGGVWRRNDACYSDFRIYATALSADDVKSLYQNSAYIDNQGNIYGAVYEEV